MKRQRESDEVTSRHATRDDAIGQAVHDLRVEGGGVLTLHSLTCSTRVKRRCTCTPEIVVVSGAAGKA